MREFENGLILSPRDLTGFLACRRLTELDRAVALGERDRPERRDPELEVLRRRGEAHEQQHLSELAGQGRRIVSVGLGDADWTLAGLHAAEERTRTAMVDGAEVISQAVFFDGRWVGIADYLERLEQPSDLGEYHYEVVDTKLASRVRPAALLQLASYASHLKRLQGRAPDHGHLVLGDGRRISWPVRDVAAYHRRVRRRLEQALDTDRETYPEPVAHCEVCRWREVCEQRWQGDDHLSLVAGLGRSQRDKLESAGVTTVAQLADSGDELRVAGIGDTTLDRLRAQARLQIAERSGGERTFELRPPAPDRGLARLPVPSPGDLFFDIEGDPFVGDDGLEYLFGVVEPTGGGQHGFHDLWAHDDHQERRAFERLVDLIVDRLERHPGMHVYHYGAYEEVALRTLAGHHGTREEEVDRILRGGILIDLYRVVRQGVRISASSYSLKELEPLYMDRRESEVTGGAESIVAYEEWLATGDEAILDDLARYNEDDCLSTWRLRDWLEERRTEAQLVFDQPLPRPEPPDAEPSDDLAEEQAETAELADGLLEGVPEAAVQRTDEQQARWLLAQLLEWHRREHKSTWWWYFNRKEATDRELVEDRDCIGAVDVEADEGFVTRRSRIYRYRFDPHQEFSITVGDTVHAPGFESGVGTVQDLDEDGRVWLKTTRGPDEPHPTSLVPLNYISDTVKREAIRRVARGVLDDGIDGAGPHRAVRDLLLRRRPRLGDADGGRAPDGALREPGEEPLGAAVRLAGDLDRSCLPVQGPPGAGKTYTAARVAVDQVRRGRRVGITALSHTAIGNLLEEICEAAEEAGVPIRGLQKAPADRACDADQIEVTGSNGDVEAAVAAGEVDVVAGTGWLFSRPALQASLDVLIVDEASQLPLADAVAVGAAADDLVLVGDPRQLSQPSRGVHPPGAGASALDHVLGGHETLPEDRGLFLETTYRLHADICAFTSEVVYEDRLRAHEQCQLRSIEDGEPVGGTGLRFVPVDHDGCRIESSQEADAVARLVGSLIGRRWTGDGGATVPLDVDDVLVVAPYNAQVAAIRERMPHPVRVGTVDRFQGQQAPVAIYSMTTSSAEEMPRGMEFLYSLDRLNVATSRAQVLSVIVASPTLLQVHCRRPEQVRLANALCRFVELAGEASASDDLRIR